MKTLKDQSIEEGGNKLTLTEDHIREKVLRKKIGYARGLGYGVKPSKNTSSGAAIRLQTQRAEEAERRAQEAEKRAEEAESRVAKLKESHLSLHDTVQTLVERLDARNL